MSNAFSGVGTKFRRWDGAGNWENLAEVNSISGPTMTRDFIDVTSLDSTGGYREFITGFRDAGTVSLAMNFTWDSYKKMLKDFQSSTAQNYEVLLPDTNGTSFEFSGLVTECPIEVPTDDKVTANITIKVSGQVIFNAGSGSGGAASYLSA